MKCHRGGFHFLMTLDFCHYPGHIGHRETHVLSCWPETSNPTSPGWPRPRLWELLLPWPGRLAQLWRTGWNETLQLEAEAAAESGMLCPCYRYVSIPQSQCSILSFSALHDGLCSSSSCNSCVTSCTVISYNTIHLEITWYFGLLDCVCVCLCEILQHDFKSLIAETNCFLCFHKSCQKLSMYSVNICWPLLKTNNSHHHWSPRFYYFLPC